MIYIVVLLWSLSTVIGYLQRPYFISVFTVPLYVINTSVISSLHQRFQFIATPLCVFHSFTLRYLYHRYKFFTADMSVHSSMHSWIVWLSHCIYTHNLCIYEITNWTFSHIFYLSTDCRVCLFRPHVVTIRDVNCSKIHVWSTSICLLTIRYYRPLVYITCDDHVL